MWIQILLGINITIGICALIGIAYNTIKTKVLMNNHLVHLAKDVKLIFKKLGKIDKTLIGNGKAIAVIQNTCKERANKK